jgi:drug/metabolite transporter (DMT)-like permease
MSVKRQEKRRGVVAIILAALLLACMGIFARYLNEGFTILQQTYLRVIVAFIFGIIFFYKDLDFKKLRKISKREWLLLLLRSSSLYLFAVTFISFALNNTKFSNASFLASIPFAVVFGFLFFKEKLTFAKVIYILVGFFGVFLIVVKDYVHLFHWGNGEIMALLSSIFFGLSYIVRKWESDFLNNKEIAVLMFGISSILLFVTSLLFNEGLPERTSFTNFIIVIILLAGIFNVANLFFTNYGFQKINTVLAGNLLILQVLFALLIGVFFYKEILEVKEIIGGLLIVLSSYQMNKLEQV